MIKKTLILTISCFAFIVLCDLKAGSAESDQIKWYSYAEGVSLGKKDGKKIFLHFYADWCHFCTEMKKNTFTDKDVISELNQNFVSILVNADKEKKIAGNYFVRGLPANFFLTVDGNKIQLPIEENRKMSDIPGFISHEMLLKLLRYVHSENYDNMTFKAYTEKTPAKP
jgi:thioredoxin-related protein